MINALTIDVEDNHRIVARNLLHKHGPPTERVLRNTHRILDHLADGSVRGTFFVLGEVAETFPGLIRAIVDAGHELGVHGFHHYEIHRLTRERFREEVRDCKALLEDLSGMAIQGHRAPTFSITPQTRWALDILAEEGFKYDSSVFPFHRDERYGWADFPLDIHQMTLDNGRNIVEAPLPVVSILWKRLPACGGGYLRHFPYWYTRWAMSRVTRHRPAIVYLHPYDIDTAPPPDWLRKDLSTTGSRVRLYLSHQRRNRHTVERKLVRLLDTFSFAPLIEVIDQTLGSNPGAKTG